MPTKLQLLDMVAAKIDEVLPPGEGLLPSDVTEGPVNYMDIDLDEAAKDIIRKAPLYLILPLTKNANKHFPINPTNPTALLSVGTEVIVSDAITGIEDVSYRINMVQYGSALMIVTAGDLPTALHSRRDIIVGNEEGQLVYIEGQEDLDATVLEYPEVPANTVLIMKIRIVDGDPIVYEAATPISEPTNPNVRLIYNMETGISLIPVPVDFMRFVSLKLDRWLYPVNSLISQESLAYINQKTKKFTRGTENKPVAAMVSFTSYLAEEISVNFNNKRMAIESFSTTEEPLIERFHYIPETLPENFPQELVDVMVLEAAARVLVKMKQYDPSNALRAQVAIYFQNQIGVLA